jgi:hypothetical protein
MGGAMAKLRLAWVPSQGPGVVRGTATDMGEQQPASEAFTPRGAPAGLLGPLVGTNSANQMTQRERSLR